MVAALYLSKANGTGREKATGYFRGYLFFCRSKTMKNTKPILFIFLLVFAVNAGAAPPLYPIAGQKIPRDHIHRIPDASALRAKGMSQQAIARAIGATGTKRIAVILVNFSGANSSTSGSPVMSPTDIVNVHSDFVTFFKNYYAEASYGKLSFDIAYVFFGGTKSFATGLNGTEAGFTLSQPMEYYGQDGSDIDWNSEELFKDAVAAAGSTINSTNFDVLFVVHAGHGQEATGDSATGDIWSQFRDLTTAHNGFAEGLTVPATGTGNSSPRGVFCHEFGHQLGLPDLYNTSSGASTVGKWCLMDYGIWSGPSDNQGSQPAHLSAWCKFKLGWITPAEISQSCQIALNYAEANPESARTLILANPKEYFLVEYRRKCLQDSYLPGEGILIWHIDESVLYETIGGKTRLELNMINNNASRPGVALEEADNDKNLASNMGEASDPFCTAKDIFTADQSVSNDGVISGITMANFQGAGTNAMAFIISQIAVSQELSIAKSFGYPNPSKAGAPVKIRAVFSRPITTGSFKIYTASGELVFSHDLTFSDWLFAESEQQNSWVYEYNWHLTNDSGAGVSSGVYFAVLEALIEQGDTVSQKQVKVAKIAVIR